MGRLELLGDDVTGPEVSVVSARLVDRNELPDWMKPSPGINTGYRIGYSKCGVVRSMFELHNETLNIWTHLLTGLGWVYTGYQILLTSKGRLDDADNWCIIFVVVMGSAMFVASTLAHMCGCLSKKANLIW